MGSHGSSRWKIAGKALLFSVAVLAILAGGTAFWFHWASQSALPRLDGTVALSGLKAPVSVVRDEHGVPSFTAQSLDDLFFA